MASLFWVGGSTAYDGTTNRFATTTGGSATVALVTSADDVTFDGSSPAAAVVTTSAAISCNSLTLNTGFTGSLTMSNALTVVGAINLTQGTLNTNGQTVNAALISSSNSNTRSLTFGASTVNLSGTTSMATMSNMTLSIASSTINFTGTLQTQRLGNTGTPVGGIIAFGTLNFTNVQTSSNASFTAPINSTVVNMTITGGAVKTAVFQWFNTLIVTGTLTIGGNTTQGVNRLLVQSNSIGTPGAITATGAAVVINGDVDFQDITITGSPSWTNTGSAYVGDCGGNSGITITTPITVFNLGGGASPDTTTAWSLTTGGASGARVPLPQDTARFDSHTAATNSSFKMPRIGTMDFTGYAAGSTWSNSVAFTIFGDLTLTANMLISGWNSTQTFSGRGNQTITTAGNTVAFSPTITTGGGTYTLQDSLTVTGNMLLTSGTINTNGKTINTPNFKDSGTLTRTLTMGSSNITITSTGSAWSFGTTAATGLTVTANTAIITCSAGTFQTGGVIDYNGASVILLGSGVIAIGGGNCTVANLTRIGPGTGFVTDVMSFNGSTTTVTGTLTLTGNYGNPLIVRSDTGGSVHTVSCAGTVSATYCVIRDITATGGATFKAINSQSIANTTGWTFGYARTTVPSTTPRTPSNYLFLPGTSSNFAATPNAASLQITGDIDMRAYCRMSNWKVPLSGSFIGKWGTSPQRGYDFEIVANTGVLRMSWSTDGTGAGSLSMASTVATGLQPGQASWVRTTLQVSDGSGNRVAKFYLSNDGITWNQLGTTVTTAGVATIFASTNQMEVGHVTDNVNAWRGDMYYAEVRNGINGSIVANPDFRAATNNGFTDSAGNVWTVNSAAPAPAQLVRRT